MTQSALSHQIKGIEDQAGVELFVRRSKPLKLSAAGMKLWRRPRRSCRWWRRWRPNSRGCSRGGRGGCTSPSNAMPVSNGCSRCWRQFRKAWPEVDIDIRPGLAFDALPALRREEVDLVVSSDPEDLPDTDFTPLFDYDPVFVAGAGHPLAAKAVIEAEDFRGQTLITYPVDRARLDVFSQLLTPARVEPAAVRQVELTAMILLLVASNRGVAVLPDWVVRQVRYDARTM
jgi:LysR family transcriptional regulator, regulator for metE and metH